MTYREANIWDALFITKLWVLMRNEIAVFTEQRADTSDITEAFYLRLLVRIKQNNSFVLVAQEGTGIIGFIMGEVNHAEYSTQKIMGFCDAIYIEKEFRNKGIADQLIKQAIGKGKELGVTESEFVTVYDPVIIKAWERKGFKPVQVVYRKEV